MSFDTPPNQEGLELLPVVLEATLAADYSASATVENFAPVKASIVVAAQQDEGVTADANNLPGSDQPQDTESDNDSDPGQPGDQNSSQTPSTNPESSTVEVAPPSGQDVAAEAQAENDARKEDQEAEKDAAAAERAAEKAEKEAEKDAAKAEKDAAKNK